MTKLLPTLGLACATMIISGTAALAAHDMTFRGPSTWRKVWSSQDTCYSDNQNTGYSCVALGNKNYCGKSMYVSPSTRAVAQKKWQQGEKVTVRATSNNAVVCDITP